MKRKLTLTNVLCLFGLFCMLLCFSNQLLAQSKPLPYKCGWDNASEKSGWAQRQLKAKHWPWGANTYLGHDYPYDNPNDSSVEDWYISPAINVTGKSVLSLSAAVYVIFQSMPSSYFGVWYSKGSSDPKSGDYKELVKLTSFASTKFDNWHDTAGIVLNDSGSSVHFAFKYMETSNWFTVKVDTVELRLIHTSGINNAYDLTGGIKIYPNPAKESFFVKLPPQMSTENVVIELYDLTGKQVLTEKRNGDANIQIQTNKLNAGMYLYKVFGEKGEVYNGKLSIE